MRIHIKSRADCAGYTTTKETGSPLHCVMVGKPDYFYKRLQQFAWAKNVDDRVKFIGFVPDQDLPNLYRQAFAYVFASRYEVCLPPLRRCSMAHR